MKKIIGSLLFSVLASPWAHADNLYLLKDSVDALKTRAQLIENAKESIKIQTFTMEEDFLTRGTIGLLIKKAESDPKIKIQLTIDAMFNKADKSTLALALGALSPNLRNRIEIHEYNKFNLFSPITYLKRMHDKLFIIDDKFMILGSRNFSDSFYRIKHVENGKVDIIYRDLDLLVTNSSAVTEASRYFDSLFADRKFTKPYEEYRYQPENIDATACDFEFDRKSACEQEVALIREEILKKKQQINQELELVLSNKLKFRKFSIFDKKLSPHTELENIKDVKFLYDDPHSQSEELDKTETSIGHAIYAKILSTNRPVTIVTPYFVLTPEHKKLFAELQKRKIPVTVITNGVYSADQTVAFIGYNKTKGEAEALGVQFWEYNGPDTLHSKIITMGSAAAFIGSYNWDLLSQNNNREVGLMIDFDETQATSSNDIQDEVSFIKNQSYPATKSSPEYKDNLRRQNLPDVNSNFKREDIDNLEKTTRQRNTDHGFKFWKLIYPVLEALDIP